MGKEDENTVIEMVDMHDNAENSKSDDDDDDSRNIHDVDVEAGNRREVMSKKFQHQSEVLFDERDKKLKSLFPAPEKPILIQWENINYKVTQKTGILPCFAKKTTKHIIKNVSGSVAPGEFLAILGPSGAGKTTLLNILAGRIKSNVTGNIMVNGEPRKKTCVKEHSTFVLQDDIFFSSLTVTETLTLTARLCLPNDKYTIKEKEQRAQDMIDIVKLRKCANTIAGSPMRRGLSGGEKKRLNIANELISNATVVIMDEPTSGLDASTALQIVAMLSSLARCGKTVIATLHQPSSQMFEMFDKLLILADGRTAYLGTPSDAITYFSGLGFDCPPRYNPADFLLSLVDEIPTDKGDRKVNDNTENNYRDVILKAYEERNYGIGGVNPKHVEIPPSLGKKKPNKYAVSFFEQFYLLYKRGFKQHILEAIPQLFIFAIIATLCSIIFWQMGYKEDDIQSRMGLLFFIAIHWFVMPMFGALGVMINERVIIKKERPPNIYRLSAYMLSRSIAQLPIDLITPVLFACVVYWTTNLNDSAGRFFTFLGIGIVSWLVGISIGLVFGSAFDRQEKASPLIMVFFFICTLVGGFYVAIDKIQVWFRWTQYISIVKYVMDMVTINEFKDDSHTFKRNPSPYYNQSMKIPPITGDEILDARSLFFDDIWPYALICMGIAFSFNLLAYFILRVRTKPTR